MQVQVRVEASGPLFQPGVNQRVQRTLHNAIVELVDYGMEILAARLRPRPAGVFLSVAEARKGQASIGNYRRSLHQEVKGLHGRIDDSQIIYGPWLEGISSRNQTTRFKGYASFRWATGQIGKRAVPVLRAHVDQLIRELNG
jgi:hypothetical protein